MKQKLSAPLACFVATVVSAINLAGIIITSGRSMCPTSQYFNYSSPTDMLFRQKWLCAL